LESQLALIFQLRVLLEFGFGARPLLFAQPWGCTDAQPLAFSSPFLQIMAIRLLGASLGDGACAPGSAEASFVFTFVSLFATAVFAVSLLPEAISFSKSHPQRGGLFHSDRHITARDVEPRLFFVSLARVGVNSSTPLGSSVQSSEVASRGQRRNSRWFPFLLDGR